MNKYNIYEFDGPYILVMHDGVRIETSKSGPVCFNAHIKEIIPKEGTNHRLFETQQPPTGPIDVYFPPGDGIVVGPPSDFGGLVPF